MKHIFVTDFTLRDFKGSFKDAAEIAKLLDRSGVSTIITMPIRDQEADTMLLRTLSQVVDNSALCVPIEPDKLTVDNIAIAINSVKTAKKHAICLEIPTSDVQMEFLAHAKPKALAEKLATAIDFAKGQTSVYVSLLDATRTDFDFIRQLVELCRAHGVKGINFCDDSACLTPSECGDVISNLKSNCNFTADMSLFFCSADTLSLALANSLIAIDKGVDGVATSFFEKKAQNLFSLANVIKSTKKFACDLKLTEIAQISEIISEILAQYTGQPVQKSAPLTHKVNLRDSDSQFPPLGEATTIKELEEATRLLGYTLDDSSLMQVFDSFCHLAKKKPVTATELEAIIATSSTQARSIYTLESFLVTVGDKIATTATITLNCEGEKLTGLAIGEGPIDAAFNAMEKATGLHYELDDFQIASVTQGREALGQTIVKLRSNGRIFAGLGLSADIIESGISAYLSALNKIKSEE